MTNSARPDSPAADQRHLLVIGAGPSLGGAIAHRFAQGGYYLTLLARHTDGLAKLASDLADTGAAVDTVAADASDPEGLRATLTSLYAGTGAPGVLVYNATMLAPDSLLCSDVAPAPGLRRRRRRGHRGHTCRCPNDAGRRRRDHPVHRRRLGGGRAGDRRFFWYRQALPAYQRRLVYGDNTNISEGSPINAPVMVVWKEPIERRVLDGYGMRGVVVVSSVAYGDGGGGIPGLLLGSPRRRRQPDHARYRAAALVHGVCRGPGRLLPSCPGRRLGPQPLHHR